MPFPKDGRWTKYSSYDFDVQPEKAKIVEKLFSLYATGRYSLRQIKDETGCSLSYVQIGALLSNVFYTGRIDYDGQVSWNKHERIISDRLFNRVQKVKASKSGSESVRFCKVIENKAEIATLC